MRTRMVVALVVALTLLAALRPAGAEARRVRSLVIADVFGVIDRHGTVQYAYAGGVGAAGLTFRCMARRQVTLFHLESNGTPTPVASVRTDFLGDFSGKIERPISEIPGYYYAQAAPRRVKSKSGRLNCLGAVSDTFLVQVPAALLNPAQP